MAEREENPFHIKLGAIHSPSGSRRMMSFAGRVRRAAQRASKSSGGRSGYGGSTVREQLFSRRVIIKVNLVKMNGGGIKAQKLHLDYIMRESATRENEQGQVYDKEHNKADAAAFKERGHDDRHQFRIVVSAEDGKELTDLRAFTRDLMTRMEADLGTKLDWVAANHYDTATPHTHIVLSGKKDNGQNLVIPRAYISYGMRNAAEELTTIELGPINQMQAGIKLAEQVKHQRFTQLDRGLLKAANKNIVDITQSPARGSEWTRRFDVARLKELSRMGLAYKMRNGLWKLDEKLEPILRRMGESDDILKKYHRTLRQAGLERPTGNDVIYDPYDEREVTLTGKIIGLGVIDDVSDKSFIVLNATNGRAFYIPVGKPEHIEGLTKNMIVTVNPAEVKAKASDHTIEKIAAMRGGDYSPALHQASDQSASKEYIQAHVRRLESLRRAGHATRNKDGSWKIPHDYLDRAKSYEKFRSRAKPVDVNVQSRLPLKQLQTTMGRTWLDEEIVVDTEPVNDGFGNEVQAAKKARTQYLVQQGILENENTLLGEEHLEELERRDLASAAKKLSTTLGKAHLGMEGAIRIEGTYREVITRPSGKYAIIERAKDFSLVPWRDVLERNRGKAVSGIMRGNTISWTLNKGREIG